MLPPISFFVLQKVIVKGMLSLQSVSYKNLLLVHYFNNYYMQRNVTFRPYLY